MDGQRTRTAETSVQQFVLRYNVQRLSKMLLVLIAVQYVKDTIPIHNYSTVLLNKSELFQRIVVVVVIITTTTATLPCYHHDLDEFCKRERETEKERERERETGSCERHERRQYQL